MNPKEVKKILQQAFLNGSQLHADLLKLDIPQIHWNVICYDAFSQNTIQPLWQAEFLDSFIKKYESSDCVFTTYACTGVLKKVLTKNNFELIKKPGFSGKRESTLAYRGKFKSEYFR